MHINISPSAPINAKYLVQQSNGVLTDEQELAALATGLLKNTTTTGVLSAAVAGTDYQAPNLTVLKAGDVMTDGLRINNTADARALTLQGAVGQTDSIVEIWDSSGYARIWIDADGSINLRGAPSSDLPAIRQRRSDGTVSAEFNEFGTIQASAPSDTEPDWDIFGGYVVGDSWTRIGFQIDLGVPRLGMGPGNSTDRLDTIMERNTGGGFIFLAPAAAIVATIQANASQTASLAEWQSSAGAIYSRFNKAGYFMTRKLAAPADADLATSELALWFDDTAGAAKLMIKAKNASGTVVTGSVALA